MKTPRSDAHSLRMGHIFTHSCSILSPLASSRDAKGGVGHPLDTGELSGVPRWRFSLFILWVCDLSVSLMKTQGIILEPSFVTIIVAWAWGQQFDSVQPPNSTVRKPTPFTNTTSMRWFRYISRESAQFRWIARCWPTDDSSCSIFSISSRGSGVSWSCSGWKWRLSLLHVAFAPADGPGSGTNLELARKQFHNAYCMMSHLANSSEVLVWGVWKRFILMGFSFFGRGQTVKIWDFPKKKWRAKSWRKSCKTDLMKSAIYRPGKL
jgi:hypothetical protein